MALTIEELMKAAVHRGLSTKKLSRELSRRMSVGYNNAERLIRTELNFVQNKAAFDSMQSAGFEQYRFTATLDHRTCPSCGSLDGRIFPLSEQMPGDNAPPIHPRCRCTVIPVIDESTGRISERRVKVPAEMNYAEWQKTYIEKSKTIDEA